MQVRSKARLGPLVVLLIAVTVLGGGFYTPNPPPQPSSTTGFNGAALPDPGLVSQRMLDTSPSTYWIDASQTAVPQLPTYPLNLTGYATTGSPFDALATGAEASAGVSSVDAPSMAYIDGEWILWFTGYHNNGKPNCLYYGTDSSVVSSGSFTIPSQTPYCASVGGYFDPNVWIGKNDVPYLLFAQENGTDTSVNAIFAVQLSTNGESWQTQPVQLALYSNVKQAGPYGFQTGSDPQIENPSVSQEPGTSALDLFVSYGSFSENEAYGTVEIPCVNLVSSCEDLNGTYVNLRGGDSSLDNSAGMTVASEGEYQDSYVDFAAAANGTYGNPTATRMAFEESSNSPAYPEQGSPVLPSNQTKLVAGQYILNPVNGYKLIMQSDGNLVLYPPGAAAKWSSGSSGNPGADAVMQSDGNLVVYGSNGAVLYQSRTSGDNGDYLILQQDNNGVIYYNGAVVLNMNSCESC